MGLATKYTRKYINASTHETDSAIQGHALRERETERRSRRKRSNKYEAKICFTASHLQRN